MTLLHDLLQQEFRKTKAHRPHCNVMDCLAAYIKQLHFYVEKEPSVLEAKKDITSLAKYHVERLKTFHQHTTFYKRRQSLYRMIMEALVGKLDEGYSNKSINQTIFEQIELYEHTYAVRYQLELDSYLHHQNSTLLSLNKTIAVWPIQDLYYQTDHNSALFSVLQEAKRRRVHDLIIDLTAVNQLSATATKQFNDRLVTAQLIGVEICLTGILPNVSESLVLYDQDHLVDQFKIFPSLQIALVELQKGDE
ncbi:STAS domain-containing protein [Geomicrobium sediminis]|uniref:Anti-anti-sigma regulatory factor n=1 Tax=Geomicrobium sediminis TaxID=1347788 RepID=A0ABS2PGL1_9BACL|nr:STAS domain-containing protein [Geomicrobium sediminis]MBM7634481.1 anti-anti-sigma regulatory factor [Geomicrobium sediminis]